MLTETELDLRDTEIRDDKSYEDSDSFKSDSSCGGD